MGAQAWVAVFILAVAAVIVLTTLSALSLLTSAASTAIGIAEQVTTGHSAAGRSGAESGAGDNHDRPTGHRPGDDHAVHAGVEPGHDRGNPVDDESCGKTNAAALLSPPPKAAQTQGIPPQSGAFGIGKQHDRLAASGCGSGIPGLWSKRRFAANGAMTRRWFLSFQCEFPQEVTTCQTTPAPPYSN